MNEDNARPWTSRGCPCISPRCQDSGHLAPSVRRSPSWALGTGHLVSTPAGKRTAAGQETHAHVVKEAPGYGPDTRTWQSARRGRAEGHRPGGRQGRSCVSRAVLRAAGRSLILRRLDGFKNKNENFSVCSLKIRPRAPKSVRGRGPGGSGRLGRGCGLLSEPMSSDQAA